MRRDLLAGLRVVKLEKNSLGLYHSPNMIRMIKSRKFSWAGHLSRMEGCGGTFKIVTGKPVG